MTRFLKGTDRPLAEAYQLALLDLDGVDVEPWQVITSSVVAARMVAKALPAGARVQVLGADHLRDEVTRNGLTIVNGPEDHPQAVIQGWYPEMTWQMMAEVSYAVEAGATYFVTNRDLTIPREMGIAPGCGSMIRAVITATGVEPVASAGKPEAYMYDEARELNAAEDHDLVPKESSIAIGDRLDTDIEAGNRGGYDSLAVLTGVTNPTELMLAPEHLRPTFIARDLRELGEIQSEPVRCEDGTWECRKASAWFENGRVQVSDPTSMDGLRAAVCAAWEAADKGAQMDESMVPNFTLGEQ